MEQIKMVKMLISLHCCVMVAGFNASINSAPGMGASTHSPVLGGTVEQGVTFTSQAISSINRRYVSTSSRLVCANGIGTVSGTQLCNGRIDCPDSSDENTLLCYGISCNNTFPCLNGKCLGLNYVCNGFNECGDHSDEDSTMCGRADNTWGVVCGNGQVLIGVNNLCNGVYNCMDKSDEFNCTKCPGGLSCDRGRRCVKSEAICDRIQDCYDGADERCLTPNNTRCNVGDFICPTGICVKKDKIMSGNRCWGSQVLTPKDNQKYCKPPNVLCDGGNKCIAPEYRCDGKLDCQDGTDEMSPNKNIMSGPSYKCGNGFCVPYLALCNNTDECGDNSDEDFGNGQCPFSAVNCSSVANFRPFYWQCNNNLCISSYQVNNGMNNCGDLSDEKNSTSFYFRCSNKEQVLRSFLCDGRDNCGDNSDETDWSCTANTTRPICPQQSCPSGKCISYTDVCDGYNDCGDNSDETGCPPCYSFQFTCTSGQCIASSRKCNGIKDCSDNSDELSCPPKQTCGQHTCTSGKCITFSDVCDGYNDCGDNSDETGCASCQLFQYRCTNGQCVPSSNKCNGVNDCGDNSDETDWTCISNTCSEHTCPLGTCILYSDVCDGNDDCGDDSDESYCSWTYTHSKVAVGVCVPGGVIIFVGGCFGYRRRRMKTTTRTTRAPATTRTTRTPARNRPAVTTIPAISNNLPLSYAATSIPTTVNNLPPSYAATTITETANSLPPSYAATTIPETANSLPPSYEQAVGLYVTSQAYANLAFSNSE